MFTRVFSADILKLRRSKLWILIIMGPLFGVILGLVNFFLNIEVFIQTESDNGWIEAWTQIGLFYSSLIYPVLTGVFVALLCRNEYSGGGWKLLLALPVRRYTIYISKFALAILLLALTQFSLITFYLITGWISNVPGSIPWALLFGFGINGWIATLPLAAIQMLFSIRWNSFGIPLAINIVLSLPVVLAVNSVYGQFYPWALPALAMSPSDETPIQSFTVFYLLILIVFSAVFTIGLIYFSKRDMN